MFRLPAVLALCLLTATPVLAFDAATETTLSGLKRGKPIPIAQVAELMMRSELWCYNQRDTECAWSDIYLGIDGNTVSFEITNPWDADRTISSISQGKLRDNRFICDTGFDWLPSVRAFATADGKEIYGRDLAALKVEIEHWSDIGAAESCFDYVLQGRDDTAQTVTLLQRQYRDGETDPADDATVTLHFDAATAASLTWYW